MKSVISLKMLFVIAKNCPEYSDFAAYLSKKYLKIPSTDVRCLEIKLIDLIIKENEKR